MKNAKKQGHMQTNRNKKAHIYTVHTQQFTQTQSIH